MLAFLGLPVLAAEQVLGLKQAVEKQANGRNVLVKSWSEHVQVYLLTTGEIQVNSTESNKVFVTVIKSLEAKILKHALLEA